MVENSNRNFLTEENYKLISSKLKALSYPEESIEIACGDYPISSKLPISSQKTLMGEFKGEQAELIVLAALSLHPQIKQVSPLAPGSDDNRYLARDIKIMNYKSSTYYIQVKAGKSGINKFIKNTSRENGLKNMSDLAIFMKQEGLMLIGGLLPVSVIHRLYEIQESFYSEHNDVREMVKFLELMQKENNKIVATFEAEKKH